MHWTTLVSKQALSTETGTPVKENREERNSSCRTWTVLTKFWLAVRCLVALSKADSLMAGGRSWRAS